MAGLMSWTLFVLVTQCFRLTVCNKGYWTPEDPKDLDVIKFHKMSTPEECDRKCEYGAEPKICYYDFRAEYYMTVGLPCANSSEGDQCIMADGVERTIMCVNRQMPGPSITVCEGDTVVVDVTNSMSGTATTIHWHGIFQTGTQYSDGTPQVTQCPITETDVYRYYFKPNPGTYFWHAHTGVLKVDGLAGPLIVRQATPNDPHGSKCDEEHVVFITDWMHELSQDRLPGRAHPTVGRNPDHVPDNILVNGKGDYTDLSTGITTNSSLAVFTVKPGKSYRFRLIGAQGSTCSVLMSIESHSFYCIATDGVPVEPLPVQSIVLFSGERYDIMVKANQTTRSYWMQFRGLGECVADGVQQLAILRYEGAPKTPPTPPPTYNSSLPQGMVLNPPNYYCNGTEPNVTCVTELRSCIDPADDYILTKNPDVVLPFLFRLFYFDEEDFNDAKKSKKGYKAENFLSIEGNLLVFMMNKTLVSKMTVSPLLSQRDEIDPELLCNSTHLPAYCEPPDPCYCTRVHHIELGSYVEMILLSPDLAEGSATPPPPPPDAPAFFNHPFHLHGYNFRVLGKGRFPSANVTEEDISRVLNMDRRKLLRKQAYRPPLKDTVAVPNNGYVILRFQANNPGYWLLHCHFAYHIVVGMEMIFEVGNKQDLPPVPLGFPRCGPFTPFIITI